jgi:kynurenine--oxoglutarate transaminase/cysteine-S-conjugate beta-lyase/glutamine--phenylpyruvate transaminase
MLGLLNPGDEVVTLEPAFDIYIAQAEMAGASLKTVPYRVRLGSNGEKEWYVDLDELRAAFSSKTKMFLLNTPHNPTGKVFTLDELTAVSKIVQDFPDVVAVADEVYEHMVYDAKQHISLASLPGMFERTLTVSSAGKTFSVTGWKVGWAIGPAHLVRSVAVAHQWLAFSVCTPMQQAMADSLIAAEQPYEGASTYYDWLNSMYCAKRTLFADALRAAGIEPIIPEGGFFIVGDTSALVLPEKYAADKTVTRDWALCRWLTEEIGVAAIPPSSFYSEENKHLAGNYARFAFCKPDDVLQEAAKRLLKCREYMKK